MALTRAEIYSLVVELKNRLTGATLRQFQEIASRCYLLHLEKGGTFLTLFLCFQEPHLRFHLWTGRGKARESFFANELGTFLHSCLLKNVEMLNADRIVQWSFYKGTKRYDLVGEFFPKRPNLYLLNDEKRILMSLNPTEDPFYHFPENVQSHLILPVELAIQSIDIEKRYEKLERETLYQRQKQAVASFLHKQVSRSKKALKKGEEALKQCQKWKEMQHEALLLQAHLHKMHKGMQTVSVFDWEKEGMERTIALDPSQHPQEEIEKRFKQSKKLKAGVVYAEKRVAEAQKEYDNWKINSKRLCEVENEEALKPFLAFLEPPPPPDRERKALPYYEFSSRMGVKIWVGKNAQSNEKLTFSLARGSDWWFHVNEYPGSHVILKVNKNSEPDPESIQDAIQLAIAYSKAKDKGEVEVYMTQCKFISRMGKGKMGKVQVSKHRTVHSHFDPERMRHLKTFYHRDTEKKQKINRIAEDIGRME